MKMETLKKAAELAEGLRYIFIATVDAEGLPHMALAGRLTFAPDEHVMLMGWFGSNTVANLQQNRRIAIVAWDAAANAGYQLLGEVEEMRELAVLNGYVPNEKNQPSQPQVERELLVHVKKITNFDYARHNSTVIE